MSFCKIAVLKHFEIFTREHRCRGLFFNKAASFRPTPLFKRVSNTFVFSEFCKIFRNNFFMELLTRTAIVERFCAFLSKFAQISQSAVNFLIRGCSYGGELARLGGLARLGEMVFIPRSNGIFCFSSNKKFVMSLEKVCLIKQFLQ